jgi:hypothetical protein
MDPADEVTDDAGSLIQWMGERGKVSIEGGRELWMAGTRMRSGWFVQWFQGDDGELYSSGQDETLIGALQKATESKNGATSKTDR